MKKRKDKPPYRVPSMAEIAKTRGTNGYDVVSLFAGGGGSSTGYEMAGFRVVWANEFLPHARAVYHANHPETIIDPRDVRTIQPEEILEATGKKCGELDVLDGSPPCFPAGTTVLSDRGMIPIEDVEVGDHVLTHKLRWRPVIATGSRQAEVIGVDGGRLACTPGHRVLARVNDNSRGISLGGEEWARADSVAKRFWALPGSAPALDVPDVGRGLIQDEKFWWFVGAWLAEGWLRIDPGVEGPPKTKEPLSPTPRVCLECDRQAVEHKRYSGNWTSFCGPKCRHKRARRLRRRPRHEVLICCAFDKPDYLRDKIKTVAKWSESQERTAVRFTTGFKALTLWLRDHFGRGAGGKTLPGWLFGMPEAHRLAVLEGYLWGDGRQEREGEKWSFNSISKPLAIGMRLLATGLGYTSSISLGKVRPGADVIEGRKVTTRPSWTVRIVVDDGRYTRMIDGLRWQKVRRQAVALGSARVYDVTVEGDASFVADGHVVHNCDPFSTAGKGSADWGKEKSYYGGKTRQRTDDLFFEYIRILKGLQPRVFVAENVAGLVKGKAKGYFLQILAALKATGYNVEARVLDAQWLGVPQSRARTIFIGTREAAPLWPIPWAFQYSVKDLIPDAVSQHPGGSKDNIVKPWTSSARPFYALTARSGTLSASAFFSGGHFVRLEDGTQRRITIVEAVAATGFPSDYTLGEDPWGIVGMSVAPLMMRAIAEKVQEMLDHE